MLKKLKKLANIYYIFFGPMLYWGLGVCLSWLLAPYYNGIIIR